MQNLFFVNLYVDFSEGICVFYIQSHIISLNSLNLHPKGYNMKTLRSFVKMKRKELGLTQHELALNAGVGLNFVRDFEQGKKTLRLDKVNDILALFGKEVGAIDKVEK